MTPKERAAMQQALDTILNSIPHYPDEADEAISALREALAEQAEQEPVAWCYFCEDALWGFFTDPDECDPDCDNEMPLYAAPVRTKDLTDDEIAQLVEEKLDTWNSKNMMTDFARAVIAADRKLNK